MKIDLAITNDNQKSEICRFISAINKFNIFFKQIEKLIMKQTNLRSLLLTKKMMKDKLRI